MTNKKLERGSAATRLLAIVLLFLLTLGALFALVSSPASARTGLLYNSSSSSGNVFYKTSSASTATYQIVPGATQPFTRSVWQLRTPPTCPGRMYIKDSGGYWRLATNMIPNHWYPMKGSAYSPDVLVRVDCP